MTNTEIIQAIQEEIEKLIKRYSSVKKANGILQEGYKGGRLIGYEDALDVLKRIQDVSGSSEISKDLEKASDEYAEKHGFRIPYDGSDNFYDDVDVKASKEGFITGAKWDRQQIMKEAMEGVAHPDDCEIWVNLVGYGSNIKDGDKVRVIIVRED